MSVGVCVAICLVAALIGAGFHHYFGDNAISEAGSGLFVIAVIGLFLCIAVGFYDSVEVQEQATYEYELIETHEVSGQPAMIATSATGYHSKQINYAYAVSVTDGTGWSEMKECPLSQTTIVETKAGETSRLEIYSKIEVKDFNKAPAFPKDHVERREVGTTYKLCLSADQISNLQTAVLK